MGIDSYLVEHSGRGFTAYYGVGRGRAIGIIRFRSDRPGSGAGSSRDE
jgi:hypothetical protein